MPTVGQTIKAARVELRLSQQALGDRVGVTRVAVSEWERDASVPRVKTARKLAQVLGIDEGSLTPLGRGGVVPISPGDPGETSLPIDWADIPRILEDGGGLRISTNSEARIDETRPTSLLRLEVEDDSMCPVFNVGDVIILDRSEKTWDGCQVVAANLDGSRGVLRNLRIRQFGGYDLWANNPKYPTDTMPDDAPARVVGVVVAHERRINRPPGA
jgi:transcriptional regulator with XRE-family HTH domain